MSCQNCGSSKLSFVAGNPERRDEPGTVDGWECLSCGAWQESDLEYDDDDKQGDD